MSLNFNVEPYYDDFDPTKNYHRILFKPGYAVQARELTQSQTILQDQVTKFADNIFKQNSPVTGGQVTTNFNCYYIKLNATYNGSTVDVNQWKNKIIQNADGTISAQVIAVAAATGGDPNTLIVSYKSGEQFGDNETIYDSFSNLRAQSIADNSTGLSSVASIAQGVFYVSGNYTRDDGIVISNGIFVQVNPQTIPLDKYSNTPSKRIGLNITETIQDYVGDTSLLDPAIGASNYQAPGADRYLITLELQTRSFDLGDDEGFVQLVRVENGNIQKLVDGSVYNVIDDYFAKRDYETNGDYVVNDFKLTPKTNDDSELYTLSVGKGLAYVRGYRVDSQAPVDLVSSRARTTETITNNPVSLNYGSYFYVDNVNGANTYFFDTTSYGPVDFHCAAADKVIVGDFNSYNSSLIATGFIRALIYDQDDGTGLANNIVYKAYVCDLQNNVVTANAFFATTNTITFPSYYPDDDNAYVGVNISIIDGTDEGDSRVITAYNGATKVATVNQNWTVVPDTTSVFSLNFDIKDIETILSVNKVSYPATIKAKASISNESKRGGVFTGDTILENPLVSELLFTIGSPYVSTLTNTAFTTQQEWRNVAFTSTGGGVSATLAYTGDYSGVVRHFGTPGSTLSASLVEQNYTIVVTNSGASTFNVGDVVPWTTAGRTVSLDGSAATATLSATDAGGTFTADILAKVFVVDGDNTSHILKLKHLITANTSVVASTGTTVNTHTTVDDTTLTSTGQIYINNAGLVTPGTPQSLYLSDVKRIVKILDTGYDYVVPTTNTLGNFKNITNNYIFDNGQRDNFYDHASITLKPGAPQPNGNILVFVDYYQHSGGDGFFSIASYGNEEYQRIPQYISKHGITYSLRDCLDFRPSRKNAQASFIFRYANSASNYGIFLPVDLTNFDGNYTYYLGRKDKLVLTKDKSFQIVEGTPSVNPIFPAEPDGALVIAQLVHTPYTGYIPTEAPNGYVPDLSIQKVKHKRYTMQDISKLEDRINQVEYYTSLSLLEQKASTLQIQDAYGLNRFKNGIMVDDFSSYSTADTVSNDYNATINRRTKQMTATQDVKNFPLKALTLAYNMGLPSAATSAALQYAVNKDGFINYFSLPISSTSNVAVQKFASRTVNVNPFSFSTQEGVLSLSPNMDNWVDTNYSPALLITDPDLQVFRANSQAINVMTAGDWQTISGTSITTTTGPVEGHGVNWSPFGFVGYVATNTYSSTTQKQTNYLGAYDKIGNTYSINNGYITDISVLPYIRPQQIVVRAENLLFNSTLVSYFDNINVDKYIRKTNIIELTGVTGTFKENDVIGYYSGGLFTGTARIVGTYIYPDTTKVRLYVAADQSTTSYTINGTIQNAYFDSNGVYQTSDAQGALDSSTHYGGRLGNAITTTQLQLSSMASNVDDFYTGSTIYICSGAGAGQAAQITYYSGVAKVAVINTAITVSPGDIYSIGSFRSNEAGSFFGVFNLPENTFHTGQRVLRIDNSTGGNQASATTYAQGTYYAEGLQTTSQSLNFGSSPAGAAGVFTQTNSKTTTTSVTTYSPWDPVAQTFIIDGSNYPNGIFLNDIKLFFRTKAQDNSPVTLSIVGTLNGYPNGQILDHSIVTVTPDQIKTSENPQYLDPNAATTFKFNAPVYIQPNVLYAIIVKSNSSGYFLWTASNGDTAISSSVKNLPNDPTPATITKIASSPYVGGLFISQNAQTWTADQNQSLMFVANRAVFNTSLSPTIQFVVPKKLPQRTLINQSVDYYLNANSISTTADAVSNNSILVDAFNITTTDFTPSTTNIRYNYGATLVGGSSAGQATVTPGKYGTSAIDNIYLNDGLGERVLDANSMTSFVLYTTLSSNDNSVSPIISDAGLTTYAITWNVNNCELSNSLITLTNAGAGYNVNTTSVIISSPTGPSGSQAYAAANVSQNGVITSVYITSPGSGYIETPTIEIVDANSAPGTGATAIITGETSAGSGPALAKYVTKKVVLDSGFDSGDLNVYLTAYRPVNTDIQVYYKILNRSDTDTFESKPWKLMTKINSSGSSFSETRNDNYEYVFAPGTSGFADGYVTYTGSNGQTYTSFSQFAVKVILTTTDKTAVPYVTDLRAIALPSNVNTTV